MKQRVMIAGALLCNPQVLIADEPTTALDVTIQAQVLNLLKKLTISHSMGTLLITHDMGVVAEVADEVIVMYAGRAVERGSVSSIFSTPSHPYTQGLLASRPSLARRKTPLSAIKGTVPPPNRFPPGCRFHPRCPFAMEICRSGPVTNFELGENHQVECWLYRETGGIGFLWMKK